VTSIILFYALLCSDDAGRAFNEQFEGYEACLIVHKVDGGFERVFNMERASVPFSPCSTFKIPHAVFALHFGVTSPEEVFQWDGTPQQLDRWERDFTLSTAIEYSAVPVFQTIAQRIGVEREKELLKALNYGNQDITGGLEKFWLTSTLKISATKQRDLLIDLVKLDWPASKSSQRWIKSHLLVEEGSGYRLFGKTGSGVLRDGWQLGWWVGWVESGEDTWVFVGNYEGPDSMGHRMKPKVDAVLYALGLIS